MLKPLFLCALAMIAAMEPTSVQASDQLFVLNGACQSFVINDDDLTDTCDGKLLTGMLANGREVFMFVMDDKAIFQFSGVGANEVHITDDKVKLPVDRFTITLLGIDGAKPTPSPANGHCTYENPLNGAATTVCEIQSRDQQFTVVFVSDGKKPLSVGP